MRSWLILRPNRDLTCVPPVLSGILDRERPVAVPQSKPFDSPKILSAFGRDSSPETSFDPSCRSRERGGPTEFLKSPLPSPPPSPNTILPCFSNLRRSRNGHAQRNRMAHLPPSRSFRRQLRSRKPPLCYRRRIVSGTWRWPFWALDRDRSFWAPSACWRSHYLPW